MSHQSINQKTCNGDTSYPIISYHHISIASRANKKWSSSHNEDINQSVQHEQANTWSHQWPVPELTSVQPITTPNSRLHHAQCEQPVLPSLSHVRCKHTTPPPSNVQSKRTISPPFPQSQNLHVTPLSHLTTPSSSHFTTSSSPHSRADRELLPQPHSCAQLPVAPFCQGYNPGPKPKAADYESGVEKMLLWAMHKYACLILATDAFPSEERQTEWAKMMWWEACKEYGLHYECSVPMIRMISFLHHYHSIKLNVDMK